VPHRSHAVQSTAHANPYVERVIGSIRRECLNHVIVFGERLLRRIPDGFTSATTKKPGLIWR
jgi:hypothetical protein